MLSKDFIRPIVLDMLRTGIPGIHMSGGIQHKKGAITHTFDEELETLLSMAQLLDSALMLRSFVAQLIRDASKLFPGGHGQQSWHHPAE